MLLVVKLTNLFKIMSVDVRAILIKYAQSTGSNLYFVEILFDVCGPLGSIDETNMLYWIFLKINLSQKIYVVPPQIWNFSKFERGDL